MAVLFLFPPATFCHFLISSSLPLFPSSVPLLSLISLSLMRQLSLFRPQVAQLYVGQPRLGPSRSLPSSFADCPTFSSIQSTDDITLFSFFFFILQANIEVANHCIIFLLSIITLNLLCVITPCTELKINCAAWDLLMRMWTSALHPLCKLLLIHIGSDAAEIVEKIKEI